ncbi:EamA family transporter [Candidatus Dojkabacteria bacterium]|nr:EamA family transporter [Candidatus Dojkabacteria bacterium]
MIHPFKLNIMSDTLLAFVYGIVAMVAFGFSNGFARKLAKDFGAAQSIILRNSVIVITFCLFFPFFISQVNFNAYYIFIGVIIVTASYLGIFFFYKALEKGDVGVVAPISSTRIVFSMILGLALLGDSINGFQFFAIISIMIGLIILSINFRKFKNSDFLDINSGVPYAILAAIFWGFTLPLFKIPSKELGAFLYAFIVEICVLIISTLQVVLSEKKLVNLKSLNSSQLLTALFVGFFAAIASLALNFGYATGKISIVAALTGANTMVAAFIGVVLFREKLDLKKLVGIVIIIGAVVIIGLTS